LAKKQVLLMDIKVTVNPVGGLVSSTQEPDLQPKYSLIVLHYDDYCKGCGEPMKNGSVGMWNQRFGIKHVDCYKNNRQPIQDLNTFLNSW
jgi:hypothetical protein